MTHLAVCIQEEAWSLNPPTSKNEQFGGHAALSTTQGSDYEFRGTTVIGVNSDIRNACVG
jgi:hypothetical protein